MKKTDAIKKIMPLILVIAAITVFWICGFADYLNRDYLLQHKAILHVYITDNFLQSLVLFGAVYTCVVALSLPFASFMTLAAGFLFGFYYGVLVVVIAATLGATMIFMIAKGSLGGMLRAKVGRIYQKIETDMNANAASYLLFLRLVPIFPFFLVNIAPALFNIKARTFIWTTALGILPGTAVYVNIGRSLEGLEDPSDLISFDIVMAITVLGIFALLPTMVKKLRAHKRND